MPPSTAVPPPEFVDSRQTQRAAPHAYARTHDVRDGGSGRASGGYISSTPSPSHRGTPQTQRSTRSVTGYSPPEHDRTRERDRERDRDRDGGRGRGDRDYYHHDMDRDTTPESRPLERTREREPRRRRDTRRGGDEERRGTSAAAAGEWSRSDDRGMPRSTRHRPKPESARGAPGMATAAADAATEDEGDWLHDRSDAATASPAAGAPDLTLHWATESQRTERAMLAMVEKHQRELSALDSDWRQRAEALQQALNTANQHATHLVVPSLGIAYLSSI